MSGETWDEKLSRVRSMASDGDMWQKDMDALLLVLGMLGVALGELASQRGTSIVDEEQRVGEYVQRVQAGRAG